MNRRRFIQTVGAASGASVAGCSDLSFNSRSLPDDPMATIRYLERERAVQLYERGVSQAASGDQAADGADATAKQELGLTTEAAMRGQAAGYYDSAAASFDMAAKVLSDLSDLPASVDVETVEGAREKAYHLGMAARHDARATMKAAGDKPALSLDRDKKSYAGMQLSPTKLSKSDDDGDGMQSASSQQDDDTKTKSDDDNVAMKTYPTEVDDDNVAMKTYPTETDNHYFKKAKLQTETNEDDVSSMRPAARPDYLDDDTTTSKFDLYEDMHADTSASEAKLAKAHYDEAAVFKVTPATSLYKDLELNELKGK